MTCISVSEAHCISIECLSPTEAITSQAGGAGGGARDCISPGLINSRENILVLSQRIVHISDIGRTFKARNNLKLDNTSQASNATQFNLIEISLFVDYCILANLRYKKFKSLVANLHLY